MTRGRCTVQFPLMNAVGRPVGLKIIKKLTKKIIRRVSSTRIMGTVLRDPIFFENGITQNRPHDPQLLIIFRTNFLIILSEATIPLDGNFCTIAWKFQKKYLSLQREIKV